MWRFLKKLDIELPYDPAIPLLGIYPEEVKIERAVGGGSVPVVLSGVATAARNAHFLRLFHLKKIINASSL